MQVTETLSDGLKRAYIVILPGADIESRRTARLADLGKTLRIPGFRPGKVPLLVVRQRYGTAVAAEVLEQSVEDALRQVMSERGLRPAVQPKVDVVSEAAPAGAAADLEFKVEVELLPDIALPDFGAIELTRLTAEVAPETVDKALAEIANRNRTLTDIAAEELGEHGAEKGQVVQLDYVGRVDGAEFPGGRGSDVNVEVGGPGFIPGFTEQIEGVRPGETRTIEVNFPEEYGVKEVAGKAATFEVTAKALKRPETPVVDDTLAEKLGFERLDELKEFIASQVKREYDGLSRMRLKRELLDALHGRVNFALPDGMVEAEFAQIWARLDADRQAGRLDEDDKNKDDATLRADHRSIAERRVRLGLLLAEIGRLNGVQVGAEEMTRAIRVEAGRYPGQEAQVMEFFRKNPRAAEPLTGPIFEDKVVDYLLELARVSDRTVSPEELAKEPEAEAEAVRPEPA
ncbi:MAG: trigger factor [Pseudomonadota bacterium]|nr:trigger factor [Pseudomonadota bacterium]